MLALRNQIFPPITEEQFLSVTDLTAVVASDGEESIGVLPLAIRDFQLGPGESCKAAFLHAVGTRLSWRGRGVGKQMVAVAKQILRDRVEALFVYRTGGERTDGYAFYRKAGFHELLFATVTRLSRNFSHSSPALACQGDVDEIVTHEAALLKIFHAQYGAFGGYWVRRPGFYAAALRSSYFLSRPHKFTLLRIETAGETTAYAMVGRPLLPQDAHRLVILEISTLPGKEHTISDLFSAIDELAPTEVEICFPTSTSSPLWPHIRPYIQEETVRSPVLLGCLLDPAARARRGWKESPSVTNFEVNAWIPSGDLPLHHAGSGRSKPITLGLKEDVLLRLLLRRLDLPAACRIEAATLHGAETGDEELLAQALPAFPWVYHGLDYL